MKIDLVNDIGAPVAVTAVDLITETTIPQYNEWAAYILAVGGYVGAWQNMGGEFVKNIGIASFPWAAKKIYERVRAMGGTTQLALHKVARPGSKVSRYPAPAYSDEFAGVRLD